MTEAEELIASRLILVSTRAACTAGKIKRGELAQGELRRALTEIAEQLHAIQREADPHA